jgi:uncharacterized protein (TIGR03790 family)
MRRRLLLLVLAYFALGCAAADGLRPDRLGVIFSTNDDASGRVARYYARQRHVPTMNVVGLPLPDRAVINRDELNALRIRLLALLPSSVQSLLLVWSRPYAVECMSITTAMAAGYRPGFCEPGCALTLRNPLFDTRGWLPADTVGWLPAMLLPSEDEEFAEALIDRGIKADDSRPRGTLYLIRTQDGARNVRAAGYPATEALVASRVGVREFTTPIARPPEDIIGYFTGVVWVEEMPRLDFRPGAVADHLTSSGGKLDGSRQMSALQWLRQGATASYGTVSEPCAHVEKFPDPAVLFDHYLQGDTLLEAYWKSVAMPGQGLFIGEPLAAPYRGP